ncbi:radical SAM protein [Paenibacillus sp. SYP-B3998]|uniref:Radical SAM protein n=1 Tax=Paenibacillus sp. SYP-B3998 TaxID=2678564 RepID=A0A6G3ZV28_9BACL|nr:radical SAM protein [Paenibacillus sp. SYP-B3998]NEW05898.1 radical SAM protein [Paenibacillus sp. SYP-B3998]
MALSGCWVPSRYTISTRVKGKGSVLYNSYTGAIAAADSEEYETVLGLLDKETLSVEQSSLVDSLCDAGFLVPAGTDELLKAQALHNAMKSSKSMHLVIMPTEACNFRCTYCYQKFSNGAMSRQTIDGLKAYIRHIASEIDHLAVSWFGGEPLLVPEIIAELSDSFLESCSRYGVGYSADMSTNGYFLTMERFAEMLERNVCRFMITLDGVGTIHDNRRKLRGGGRTYEAIISNLKTICSVDAQFKIDIRVNYDEDNKEEVPELLDELSTWFGGDERFQIMVRPVGRWGGPNDDLIPVCDRTAAETNLWELTEYGLLKGLPLSESIVDVLMPAGAVCYAAKPNSLVIGADGRLYKCSVALDDEVNQVGWLLGDGSLELDMNKISLWTSSGEERDVVCRACHFRPACQGNHCPLYRMRTGKRPCPHEKRKIKRVLELLWKNHDQREGGGDQDEVDSACRISGTSREDG